MHYSYKQDISLIQKKLSDVYRDTLNTTLDVKSKYFEYDNKLDIIKEESDIVKEKLQESNKKMELYLTEREEIRQKM